MLDRINYCAETWLCAPAHFLRSPTDGGNAFHLFFLLSVFQALPMLEPLDNVLRCFNNEEHVSPTHHFPHRLQASLQFQYIYMSS